MKAKEVMAKYNISRPTLCDWKKSGKIYAVKLPNGQYDYKEIAEVPAPVEPMNNVTGFQDIEIKTVSDMLKVMIDFYEFMVKINFMGPEFLNRTKDILKEYEDGYNKTSER